LKFLWAYTN